MPDTGWRELTQAGWNVLNEPDEIKNKFHHIMSKISSNVENIYGDGNTGEKLVKLLSI